MPNPLKIAFAAAAAVIGFWGAAQASPVDNSQFDVRGARSWAERLVLCDDTAFLASRPDFNADRMWVRRDDGHRDLLLPPDFVGGGQWYMEGYQRLYFRLKQRHMVDSAAVDRAQNTVGRAFIEAYRRAGYARSGEGFLRGQDSYCRSMARANGEVIY